MLEVIPNYWKDLSRDLGAGQFKMRWGSWGPGMATMRLYLCGGDRAGIAVYYMVQEP